MKHFANIKKQGVIFLQIIQCAENCRFQNDGYCSLETCSNVNSTEHPCPYFILNTSNSSDGLLKITDTDKLHADRTFGNLF